MVGTQSSDIVIAETDNGKEGWRLLSQEGADVTFTRVAPTLRGLSLDGVALTPAFDTGLFEYEASVAYGVVKIII